MIHIYRATRGKYLKPIPILQAGLNWENEEYKPVKMPKIIKCEHPDHSERQFKYPSETMFYQKFHLTTKELKEAVKQWDIASLEMKGIIICEHCAKKINQ